MFAFEIDHWPKNPVSARWDIFCCLDFLILHVLDLFFLDIIVSSFASTPAQCSPQTNEVLLQWTLSLHHRNASWTTILSNKKELISINLKTGKWGKGYKQFPTHCAFINSRLACSMLSRRNWTSTSKIKSEINKNFKLQIFITVVCMYRSPVFRSVSIFASSA